MPERIPSPLDQAPEAASEGLSIDYKRVLSRVLKYWYVILISLALAITAALLVNRYTLKLYPVTTSLIIRETEETSGAELLYKNALIDPYRNYLNEPYIIKSYSLITEVVKDCGFDVVFYREGNFLTSELYPVPLKVIRIHPERTYGVSVDITILDSSTYRLQPFDQEKTKSEVFHFNDSIVFGGNEYCIKRISSQDHRSLIGQPLIMSFSDPIGLAGGYIGGLNAKWAEEGAGIIDLSVIEAIPNKGIDFLNMLTRDYQNYDLNKKNRTADRTIRFIKGQLFHIADSLGFSESQLENFKVKKDEVVLDLTVQSDRIYSKIKEYDAQLSELNLRARYYSYLSEAVKKNQNLEQIILPSAMGITDPVIVGHVTRMIELQSQLNLYVTPENGQNPIIKTKRANIDEIRKEVLEAIATLKVTDKIRSDYVGGLLQEQEKKLGGMPNQQRKAIGLERNYHLLEGLYIFLNQKMAEAEISMASNISDVIVVNPPMASGPIKPKPRQNIIIAIFLGLVAPIGFFALLELLNNKVQSKEDIEKLTQIPFIGGVGHTKSKSKLVVFEKPKSSVAESFRALRSNLHYFTNSADKKVFMITSSIGGEGKTFTTINLATVLSMSNKKILVVGADMRKPKLFDDFGLDNSVGFSNYLSASATFDDIVRKTNVSNIDLVSGGPVPPNPAELLMMPVVEDFFKEALSRYDYVLLDTPPIAIVSDALMLTKFVDHIIFVTRQGYSPKYFLRTIQEYYRTGRLEKVSILLNDISKTGPGYGYSGYGYNYGYGYSYGYGKKKDGYGYYAED